MDRTAARLSIDLPVIQVHEKIVRFLGKYMEISDRWAQGKADIKDYFTTSTEERFRNEYWDLILGILRRKYLSGKSYDCCTRLVCTNLHRP